MKNKHNETTWYREFVHIFPGTNRNCKLIFTLQPIIMKSAVSIWYSHIDRVYSDKHDDLEIVELASVAVRNKLHITHVAVLDLILLPRTPHQQMG
jgi:tRNA(Arg) A34 adenosine deaminase TadA